MSTASSTLERDPELIDAKDDYELCMRNLELCLASPTYIGLHPTHSGKLMLVRRVMTDERLVLIAVGLEPDGRGAYGIASAYCIREEKVTQWRESGQLVPPRR